MTNKERKKAIETIMAHRWKRKSPGGGLAGDKTGCLCPRCQRTTYRFFGRYKGCSSCGLENLWEDQIATAKFLICRGRADEIKDSTLSKCVEYIHSLRPLKRRR